jgi:imidazolonepropionase-like amidohydrolase
MDTIPLSWKNGKTDYKLIGGLVPNLFSLFKLMKEQHTILDATMLTYKKWSEDDSAMRYDYEITKKITAQAYKAGVTIDAGTDNDQTAFVQKEIELLVKDAGFTNIDAIIAGTLNSAKAIHIDNKTGTVSAGKVADLLLLNKNPLENIENIESTFLVIKGGRFFKINKY